MISSGARYGCSLLRDGPGVLGPVLADGQATYVPGVSERRGGVRTDLTGGPQSADGRLNAAQGFTGRRTYDAFGAVVSQTGAWAGPDGWGAPSGYREDGSSFRLVGHRLYDPAVGRFLSRDPARDGRNWYAYCGNDPVGYSDPSGLILLRLLVEWWKKLTEKDEDHGRGSDGSGAPVNGDGIPESLGEKTHAHYLMEEIADEVDGSVLPPSAGGFVGPGMTVIDGAETATKGVYAVAAYRERYVAILDDDDQALNESGFDTWERRRHRYGFARAE